jgi:manganese/iron transport system substrate-binding protein
MYTRSALVCMLTVFLLAACSGASTSNPNVVQAKPTIIATTTQIEDVLTNVAGDRMTVIGLVPRNGDPHEFEPTPADVKKVAESQAVFKNGVGLEGWLDKLVENAGGERPIFDLSQGIELSNIDGSFEEGGESDPHLWMDPQKMKLVVDNIVVGLKQLDPTGASTYDTNAISYKAKLDELDAYAQKTLAEIPTERRRLVTAHDAMGYFAARYNFTIVGAVIPGVSTDAAETTPKELATLVETIKKEQIPAIFAEASLNPKFIEQVAAEANVRVVADLYIDSLGDPGSESGTYLDFFRANVNKIAAALR